MKSISSCYCNCHAVGTGHCELCKRFHKYEMKDDQVIEHNKEQKNFKRFRKPRRKF